ncbi:MAG TPA: HAD-IA family hydrolase [Novosphingobium sp.]|nr:HAD-IA family hydrolase [Novosphingobium sp.]
MTPGPELARLLAGRTLLIFDFDGTIADSSPLHAQAFTQVLEPLGIPVDYPRLAGRSTRDAVLHSFALAGQPEPESALVEELVRQKQALGRELIASSLMALPAAAALLDWARSRFRLALVSSGSRGTIDIALGRLGLADWFDPLITADDVAQAKPDPQGFLLALDRARVAAEAALIFEDAESGFEAARRAGVTAVDARRLDSLMVTES